MSVRGAEPQPQHDAAAAERVVVGIEVQVAVQRVARRARHDAQGQRGLGQLVELVGGPQGVVERRR